MNLPVPISAKERLSFSKLILRCAVFAIVFCVFSLIVILTTSAIFYGTTNPTSKTKLGGIASLYLSTFITTFIMTKLNKEKWLFGGLILGGMIFAITLLLSVLINGESTSNNVLLRIIVLAVSLFSSFLARKKEPKNKKRKFKRK